MIPTEHAEMIALIRADKKIGRGTCSCIDEGCEDEELIEEFGDEATPDAGLASARRTHDLWHEREREIMSEAF